MTIEFLICNHREYLQHYLKKKFPKARNEEVEDTVQEALITAWRFKDKWQGKSSLKTWLTKIAVNTYFDLFRKQYVKRERSFTTIDYQYIYDSVPVDDFSETFCNTDFLNIILEDFNDNIYIETFKLNLIDQIDYKDIAIQQNIPIGTVKSRIFKARKLLQEAYLQKSYIN